MKAKSIMKCELMPLSGSSLTKLAKDCYTLIDIRPRSEFTSTHIKSAVNIHCSPLLIRRCQRSRKSIENMFLSDELRRKLQRDKYQLIILYDNTSCEENIGKDLIQMANVLQRGKRSTSIFFLDGGIQKFSMENRQLCVSSPLTLHTECRFTEVMRDPTDQILFGEADREPVQLLPHLFLGSALHAANREILQRLGITAIINVSKNCRNNFEDLFIYKKIPVDDSFNEDISSYFADTSNFIESIQQQNGKILVHCNAGMSRSVTICLAYLIKVDRLSLDDAYEFIKQRKSNISPNFNFLGQLLRLESSTNPTCTGKLKTVDASFSGGEFTPTQRIPLESIPQNSPLLGSKTFDFPPDSMTSCTGSFRFNCSIGANSPKLLPTPT